MTGPVIRGDAPFDPLRPPRYAPRPGAGNARAILGFSLSLLATVIGLVPWFVALTFIFALCGGALSFSGWEAVRSDPGRGHRKLAIAGMVLSVVALLWAWLVVMLFLGTMTST